MDIPGSKTYHRGNGFAIASLPGFNGPVILLEPELATAIARIWYSANVQMATTFQGQGADTVRDLCAVLAPTFTRFGRAMVESGAEYPLPGDAYAMQREIDRIAKFLEEAGAAHLHPHRHLHSYVHNGRIGVLLEVGCATDFTARTDEFQSLVRETALHIAALAPTRLDELLTQAFVKDTSKTIADLYKVASSKLNERIAVTRFIRWSTQDDEASPGSTPPRTPAVILSFRRSGS